MSPDAPEAVLEHIRRDQAAQARDRQDARPLDRERVRRNLADADHFADNPSHLRFALDALTRSEQSPIRAAEIRYGDQLAEWNRQTAEALHARARRQSERQQRTAKAFAALVARNRRLCHCLTLETDRSPVISSTYIAATEKDRSQPPPGALVRSANAPPPPACSRRISGTVGPSGTPSSYRSLRR